MNSICKVLIILTIPFLAHAQQSVNINSSSNKTKIEVNRNGDKFSLEYEGEVELTPDDKDVLSISKGGFMEIKKSAFGSRRRIFIEPEGGNLVRKYYVGSKETSFNPEGKKWLAEILLEVVRSSTLGAEKRINRIYEDGGAEAVLNEIEEIQSDFVKSRYLDLLAKNDLTSKEVLKVLEAVDNVHSDHHKAELLMGDMHKYLNDDASLHAYINATGAINSDHHKANVLKNMVRAIDISDAKLGSLFEITNDIDSDHHKADILFELMDTKDLSDESIELLIATTDDINSDHHKAEVLRMALKTEDIDDQAYDIFLNSVTDVNSDHHKANILIDLLDSDLQPNNLSGINLLVGRDINSDHHKAEVLKKLIRNHDIDDESIETLIRSIKSINSDHHTGEVMHELSLKELSESQLIRAIRVIPLIQSDHTIVESLTSFAPAIRDSTLEAKRAYRESVKYLNSDASQERLLRLIK